MQFTLGQIPALLKTSNCVDSYEMTGFQMQNITKQQ